jgi:glycosyltransferase involved in cell wall biosynthesis
VAPSLDILGGQAVQAERLLMGLRQEPSVEAAFLPINPRLPQSLRRLQKVRYLRTVLTSAWYCASLLSQAHRCDVIHVFSASYLSFLLAPTPAILSAKLYGKKLLLNYHSGEAQDHLQRWRPIVTPLVRLADVLVVPSDYLVEVFAQFGLPARPIPNLVDLEQFRFRRRSDLAPHFLSNRNLEPLYNVRCIIQAFAIVQREYSDASLTVAGDGRERGELEALAARLRLRNVKFCGRVAPEEMPELYDRSDIYLNSSDIDNMPLSILEAFASGLPVITTDAGGIPYVVQHEETGLLVRRGDHAAIASQIIRLLHDDFLARKLVTQAHQLSQKYTWSATRTQWLALYRALAFKKSRTAHEPVDTAA